MVLILGQSYTMRLEHNSPDKASLRSVVSLAGRGPLRSKYDLNAHFLSLCEPKSLCSRIVYVS